MRLQYWWQLILFSWEHSTMCEVSRTKNTQHTLTRFVPPFNELIYNWLGKKWAIKPVKSWLTERELLLGKIMAANCYAAALLLFRFVVGHVDDVWWLLASFRLSSCRSFVLKMERDWDIFIVLYLVFMCWETVKKSGDTRDDILPYAI